MVSPGKEQQEQTTKKKKNHQYKTTGNHVQPFWTKIRVSALLYGYQKRRLKQKTNILDCLVL